MEMQDKSKREAVPLNFTKKASRKKVIIAVAVCCGVAAVIALAVGLGVGLSQRDSKPPPAPTDAPSTPGPVASNADRIDCYPEAKWGGATVTKQDCESRGCTYDPPVNGEQGPVCYVSPDSPLGSGYRVNNDTVDDNGVRRIELQTRAPSSKRVKRSAKLENADAVFEMESGGENIIHFKLYPKGAPRYEVPRSILDIVLPRLSPGAQTSFTFNITSTDPFAFQVIRKSTGTVLWDTSVGGTVISDQFLSISTRLPSFNVYGFGENVHNSFRHDFNYTTWPLFARDQWTSTGVENHYGVHPFYTCLEETGDSHGVFLLNSNAMDYSFTPLPMLTYRTIGGVLDFYVFLGPTPENVVQQYTGLIGRPYMPPYWALGFQLCRYGYNTIEKMKEAVNRTSAAGIPQDIQYADIDHMNESMIFTVDNDNFHGLADYFNELRSNGMRTIIILDPCMISNVSDYEPFQLGLQNDIFIKWPNQTVMPPEDFAVTNTTTLLGYVWPKGKVAFPDFFLNRTHDVWSTLIKKHRTVLPFDGLWIDMNEPANFGTNDERPWNWPVNATPYWSLKCPTGPLDDPPYRTMAAYVYDSEAKAANRSGARLSDKTICMISVQGESAEYKHYDVHNLYGASQTLPTLKSLRDATGERGIVVGRSTFPGTGSHSGHWLGDNFSEWPYLKDSIVGMLEFNLFGFPYIGADICGFFGDTTAELCKRWMQLGAFYPYSRNHNQIDSKIEQDPANFNEEVTRLSREALLIRYHLLPYLYTLFHAVHTVGGTVVRPLHHEFPTDSKTWDIDKQFLWGSGLMIVPILEQNQSVLKYYLPNGRWYDFYTNASMIGGSWQERAVISNSSISLFVRGGTIFPTQDPANNTHFSRLNPFRCLVYLDATDGKATGDLFWDDGISIDTYENGNYYSAHMDATKDEFRFRIQHNGIASEMNGLLLSSVQVVGVTTSPVQVLTTSASKGTLILPNSAFVYSSTTQLLMINVEHSLSEDLTIRWTSSPMPTIDEADRIDCMPEGGDNVTCIAKGCLWNASESAGAPLCYLNSSSYGYVFVDAPEVNSTHETIRLQHLPGASMFGNDSVQLKVYLDYLNDWLIRIKIFPESVEPVYEVPVPLHLPVAVESSTRFYSVDYEKTGQNPFHIKVQRKDSNQVVWDTSIGGLTVSPQFLQLVARLPTTYVYGLGENSRASFRRKFQYETVAMFARDQPPGDEKANLYGVHPYYVCVDNATTGTAHGVLLLNSNAMEVVLGPAPSVTYRTIGGLLDFYIIFGDSSETVTKRYTQIIGRPYLPPYWALGFQLSRYGYNTLSNMEAAVQRTLDAEIPLDVQYGDIDHMETQKDFTYNKVNFSGLPQFVDQLHNQGMRFITILDPAIISTDPNYWPHTDGVSADVFIRWPIETNHSDFYRFNSTYMYGYVWPPGETLFPDFFKAATQNWWRDCVVRHHTDAFPFDGLWIDMNEPANFGTNEEKPWNWPENREPWSLKCPIGPLDDPPYKPKAIWGPRLSDKTLCLVGLQTDGIRNFTQYDVHNLYGWSQTEPSLKAIRDATGERSIVITRSTYVGSGTHGGHWLGDNDSLQWLHMLHSIVGCLDFNLFGIPYIGADICGHFSNASAELCNRWTQLGAFYTFSRNHNGNGYRDQDPASFGPEVAQSAKFITEIRYSLLPYLYTLFYRAHVEGSTVIRPLFHEFKTDINTYDVDRQFLWGPALLITPVIEENQTAVCGYLPMGARWFSFFNGLEETTKGAVCFDAPFDRIPLHVRGGQIIATQEPAINTNRSRLNPFGLIVAPDAMGSAAGELFWDDGVSIDTVISNQFYVFNYTLNMAPSGSNSTLKAETSASPTSSLTLPALASIRVFGVPQMPSGVVTTVLGVVSPVDTIYNSTTQELYLYNLTLQMDINWVTVWW